MQPEHLNGNESDTRAEEMIHLLDQLKFLISERLKIFFGQEVLKEKFSFHLNSSFNSQLTHFIRENKLNDDEIAVILLTLAPHVQPSFFEPIIQSVLPQGGDFPEFGGVRSGNHRGLIPTGETALFILAGNHLQRRLEIEQLFKAEHLFAKQNMLYLESVKEGEPLFSGRIILSHDWIEKFLFGEESKPRFSVDFPAKLIHTKMIWDDVVLNRQTLDHLQTMKLWLHHNAELEEDEVLSKKIKRGYRVLFHGPSGTGKTLTAMLLGKEFEKDVYRIDLSQVVSKYIGETEKNLEKIFVRAEDKNWILFFDEADALFGKRTNVQSSHDRYANQEVSYLLQRVEDFAGMIILASNFKSNMDAAFLRRFNQIIHFPKPTVEERKVLWRKAEPSRTSYHSSIDLGALAQKFDLTGAGIVNVIQFASLKAASKKESVLSAADILEGIRFEYQKEERSL